MKSTDGSRADVNGGYRNGADVNDAYLYGADVGGSATEPGRRRRVLRALTAVPLGKGLDRGLGRVLGQGLLAGGGMLVSAMPVASQTAARAATPSCSGRSDPTPPQTEGPYFTPNSPRRASLLEEGTSGTRLVLEGRVFGSDCAGLGAVLLDFWQADASGDYDNRGYRLRGHQFSDGQGRYRLETVLPGLYPGRTRHIHVKVQAPNAPALTTQLYFPGEAANRRDGIFSPDLLATMSDRSPGPTSVLHGSFDFVLAVRR